MVKIKDNYGKFLSMMLDTLDRKPVTNQEARNNFTDCLLEYCWIIYSLTPLTLLNNSPLKYHQEFAQKLDILLGRYMSIGNDFITDDKLNTFLSEVQSKMMDWTETEELELKKEEKRYYIEGARKNGSNRGVNSEWSWQEEKAETIKNALEKHKELAFNNLG